jgi:GntR family transcriptional regulator
MYKQVTGQIRDAIAAGSLAPGTKLPSIREMAAELGISPITIKRAYSDLESEGFIITRAGIGSFVAALDRSELRERKARGIRDEIERIVKTAAAFGIRRKEIESMINETKEGIDDSV